MAGVLEVVLVSGRRHRDGGDGVPIGIMSSERFPVSSASSSSDVGDELVEFGSTVVDSCFGGCQLLSLGSNLRTPLTRADTKGLWR